jgi:glycosyltransferase involved in cell wall biosynthesis
MPKPAKRSGNPAHREAGKRAILWASNSPWASTGYGMQTAQVTQRLKKAGHRVAIASNYGLEGTSLEWHGIKQFGRGFDMYSNDVVPAHMAAWDHENPGFDPLLISLFDVWVFKGKQWDQVANIAPWVPIDHMPAPPSVVEFLRKPNVTPIAMSQFGKAMIEREGIETLYVPHAIEKVFTPTASVPLPQGGVMTGRQFMEVDESKFIVGMNAANKGKVPNRKAFPEAFLAFALFAKQHDDAVLYIHTEDRGAMGGINLRELAEACGIPEHQITFCDQYAYRTGIPQEMVAAIYTAMDVLLMPSMSEGFGVPIIEAQGCGTPVIVTDSTAMPELLGDGWLIDGQPWWDCMQSSWLVSPSVPSIVDALQQAYNRGRERSQLAIDFASQYDADKVFTEYWLPALKALA